jgi:transglutaminase-like putative cysteine protease
VPRFHPSRYKLGESAGNTGEGGQRLILQLEPPDFHATFEVFIESGWWLVDPTRLAPIEGIVRIGSGRDASDIAFLTTDKQCQVRNQTIKVVEAAG